MIILIFLIILTKNSYSMSNNFMDFRHNRILNNEEIPNLDVVLTPTATPLPAVTPVPRQTPAPHQIPNMSMIPNITQSNNENNHNNQDPNEFPIGRQVSRNTTLTTQNTTFGYDITLNNEETPNLDIVLTPTTTPRPAITPSHVITSIHNTTFDSNNDTNRFRFNPPTINQELNESELDIDLYNRIGTRIYEINNIISQAQGRRAEIIERLRGRLIGLNELIANGNLRYERIENLNMHRDRVIDTGEPVIEFMNSLIESLNNNNRRLEELNIIMGDANIILYGNENSNGFINDIINDIDNSEDIDLDNVINNINRNSIGFQTILPRLQRSRNNITSIINQIQLAIDRGRYSGNQTIEEESKSKIKKLIKKREKIREIIEKLNKDINFYRELISKKNSEMKKLKKENKDYNDEINQIKIEENRASEIIKEIDKEIKYLNREINEIGEVLDKEFDKLNEEINENNNNSTEDNNEVNISSDNYSANSFDNDLNNYLSTTSAPSSPNDPNNPSGPNGSNDPSNPSDSNDPDDNGNPNNNPNDDNPDDDNPNDNNPGNNLNLRDLGNYAIVGGVAGAVIGSGIGLYNIYHKTKNTNSTNETSSVENNDIETNNAVNDVQNTENLETSTTDIDSADINNINSTDINSTDINSTDINNINATGINNTTNATNAEKIVNTSELKLRKNISETQHYKNKELTTNNDFVDNINTDSNNETSLVENNNTEIDNTVNNTENTENFETNTTNIDTTNTTDTEEIVNTPKLRLRRNISKAQSYKNKELTTNNNLIYSVDNTDIIDNINNSINNIKQEYPKYTKIDNIYTYSKEKHKRNISNLLYNKSDNEIYFKYSYYFDEVNNINSYEIGNNYSNLVNISVSHTNKDTQSLNLTFGNILNLNNSISLGGYVSYGYYHIQNRNLNDLMITVFPSYKYKINNYMQIIATLNNNLYFNRKKNVFELQPKIYFKNTQNFFVPDFYLSYNLITRSKFDIEDKNMFKNNLEFGISFNKSVFNKISFGLDISLNTNDIFNTSFKFGMEI